MTKLTDDQRKTALDAIDREQQLLANETTAATLLSMQKALTILLDEAGLDWNDIVLDGADKERQSELAQSIAQRILTISRLSAILSEKEVDDQKLQENVINMLKEAVATKGDSIRNKTDVFDQVFDDAVVEDTKDYSLDAEHPSDPVTNIVNDVPDSDTHTNIVGEPEEQNDLLAMFRTARKEKVAKPDITFGDMSEDGTVSVTGAFYNPETLPTTHEEFAAYDRAAIEFFQNVVILAEKAGLIDGDISGQLAAILHGSDDFNPDDVVSPEGALTTIILEQGQENSHYSVVAKDDRDISETILAAYSVSIARLRGAFVQAKLNELANYMDEVDQKGIQI